MLTTATTTWDDGGRRSRSADGGVTAGGGNGGCGVAVGATCRRAVVAAACLLAAACATPVERYYPLEAGRDWTYALTIRPASADVVTASSRVTNLDEQRIAGQTATPQQIDAFGQRRLRFIRSDDRHVVEIADQDGDAPEPQRKDPPNTILKTPLAVGASWQTTWETNQFGRRTLLPMTKTVEGVGVPCPAAAAVSGNCLHLRLAGSGAVSTGDGEATVDVSGEEWFAPGVGYVAGVFSESVREMPQNDLHVEVTLTASAPP